jgi:hypothetical protein
MVLLRMPWGGGGIKSSPVQSNPVRGVNECTISNANRADTTGAQRGNREKNERLGKGSGGGSVWKIWDEEGRRPDI